MHSDYFLVMKIAIEITGEKNNKHHRSGQVLTGDDKC